MDRRKFLLRTIQSSCVSATLGSVTVSAANIFVPNRKMQSLPSFLDTLIPEDVTASASQLGIHIKIIKHAQSITNYTTLLEIGCQWIDQQASKNFGVLFYKLSDARKFQILVGMENLAKGSIPQLFFERVKSDSFSLYYADPKTWKSLGFSGPPQPMGFPNYMDIPKLDL